jgi:hypothetical protein
MGEDNEGAGISDALRASQRRAMSPSEVISLTIFAVIAGSIVAILIALFIDMKRR